MLLHKSPVIHSTSIGRRELIKEVGFYDGELLRCQDVDLMRKISITGTLANLHEILYTYRVRCGIDHKKMVKFAKPFAQFVHTKYMNDLLDHTFDKTHLDFIWSIRYPIKDEIPSSNIDVFLFDAVAVVFALYDKFRKVYELSADDLEFIQKDLLVWIAKISSISKNYSKILDILL